MVTDPNGVEQLKGLFEIFQQNINNNITWFLAYFGLVIAISGGALVIWAKFLVQQSLKNEMSKLDERILRIVKENTFINHANGNSHIHDSELTITGLKDFTPDMLVNLFIYRADGSEVPYQIKKMDPSYIRVSVLGNTLDNGYVLFSVFWIRSDVRSIH